MTSSYIKNVRLQSKRRRFVVTMALSILIAFSLVHAAAQGHQKRITSVWTATSAEGSRVHVDSDSPINDYAGYTRGDRFYVTIPLADLPSARGSLLGRGFDDVQIQRYGDGIIISFHLQPGTTARVEQLSNRLEVVFSTPAKYQSAGSGINSSDSANRTRARRIGDASGPAPESNTGGSSPRRSSGVRSFRSGDGATGSSTTRTPKATTPKIRSGNSNQGSSKAARDGSSAPSKPSSKPNASEAPPSAAQTPRSLPSTTPAIVKASPSPSPSPSASPSPVASPNASASSPPLASPSPNATSALAASPASSQTPSFTASPSTQSNSGNNSGDNDWRSRVHYWTVWAELNWLPLLIGGVIFLLLLVLLFVWRAAKRRRAARSERGQKSAEREAPAVTVAPRDNAPSTQTGPSGYTGAEPAAAPKSSQPSPAEKSEPGGEDQEREVFEL